MISEAENFDVLVIGAGISGLAAARFYLEIHPKCRLGILERDNCVGGTWSSRRNYEHFWTQWAQGYAEFTDLPMKVPPKEDMYYGFYKSKYQTDYLEQYADHHDFAGKSLRDRIHFEFEVKSVVKSDDDGCWHVSGHDAKESVEKKYRTSKLMIASGITSVPRMPVLSGVENFRGKVIHHLDFGSSGILASPDVKHITVLGGAKSASDMVYSAVKAGKSVSWIIRPGGTGPGFYASPAGKGPYRSAYDMGSTRLTTTFGYSLLSPVNWFTRWLYNSPRGTNMLMSTFDRLDSDAREVANYKGRKSKGGFDKLEPHTMLFWQNNTGGLLHREDFFEVVAENVDIHYDHISKLDADGIHLKDLDHPIQTDAILCGTGWNHSLDYLSPDLRASLGLPYNTKTTTESFQKSSTEIEKKWTDLETKADKQILTQLPLLANPPPHNLKRPEDTPFRLYQLIAPVTSSLSKPDKPTDNDRSIAIIGQAWIGNYFRVAECQAMWATAYFDHNLSLPSIEEQESSIAKFVAYNRRRYLSTGQSGYNAIFETIAYTDRLLEELGLKSHRWNWLRDLFYPCSVVEMRGLKKEYIAKYGMDM